jgi:hypothetical protein
MDLWDVTKLLARRWYVSVPLLLVTFASALWIGVTTDPDYKDTSHVTLLPPTVRRDPQAGTTQNVNPWTVDTLIAAVITRLNSKAQHDTLEAEGLSGVWEVDTDLQFRELVNIEVTARTESQARATTARLQQIATDEVAKQQDRYNLKPGEEITTIPFDTGENVTPSRSRVIRALIVVVGVGGILTVAFVIAFDAFARWRSRQRTSTGRARPAQLLVRQRTGEAAVPPAARGFEPTSAPPLSVPLTVRTVSQTTSKPAKAATNGNSSDDTTVIATGGGRYNSTNSKSTAAEPAAPAKPVEPVEPSTSEGHHPVQEDATIVLPLSNSSWAVNSGKSDKSAESGKR